MKRNRVLILASGVDGIYTTPEFKKMRERNFEIRLVTEDDFFRITPMLRQVAADNLAPTRVLIPFGRCYGPFLSSREESFH